MQQRTPYKTNNDTPSKVTSFRFSQSVEDKKMAQKARLKEKINNVILNYLVEEGFQSSALKLSQEAAIPLTSGEIKFRDDPVMGETTHQETSNGNQLRLPSYSSEPFAHHGRGYEKEYVRGYSSIEKRKQIKFLILRGDIAEAIRVISTYYPTILDANNLLLFKLLRLNLIEMIRNHKTTTTSSSAGNGVSSDHDSEKSFLNEILTFVRENLLNKVTHSMDLLRQLEVTMSLLCFDFDEKKPSHQMTELPEDLRKLLNLSLRNECYRAVNRVILDMDSSGPPESQYQGVSIDAISLSSAQAASFPSHFQDPDDMDSSDVEINPGPDVVKSIESMISSVPEESFQTQEDSPEEGDAKAEESGSQSKLEEIAKLWLATESILLLEKFIPKKRYLQDDADDAYRL